MSEDSRSSVSRDAVSESSAASSPSSSSLEDRDARRRRPRGSSVHTTAALDVVDQRRHSLRTPATHSVHYSETIRSPLSPKSRVHPTPRPHSSRPVSALASTRPVTATVRPGTAASTTAAAALASVVPTGGDRLKHLQLHMEQLQQLYAQEIHKEELARREGFVQSMCTASITLWRYVCSKPRFFTAVKALMTQYLPATDARLYEVEENDGDLTLVLADGRAVSISIHGQSGSNPTGVVGHAVRATNQLSTVQWTAIQQNLGDQTAGDEDAASSAASVSLSSSVPSSARSSSAVDEDAQASELQWLDRHADCVLPSANDHIFFLMPLNRVYLDSGFDPEIDLNIKKRDLFEGSTTKQLLVVVLHDAHQRPLGALEALVTTRKPVQIDFLDAFASLLAAALEARRSICRPTTGAGLSVQIVHENEPKDAASPDALSGESTKPGVVALEIAPGTKMVVMGGTNSQSTENDLPLLTAVQKPMAELFSQSQQWRQRAKIQDTVMVAEQMFWTTIAASVLTTKFSEDDVSENEFRARLRTAVQELSGGLPTAVQFNLLFEGETLDEFARFKRPNPEVPRLSVEGQFAALERAIRTGETFVSTPLVSAIPVIVGVLKAAVLVLLDCTDAEDEAYTMTHTLPLVLKSIELTLWAEECASERAAARVETELIREAIQEKQTRLRETEVVLHLSEALTQCKSLEEIVTQVHRLDKTLRPTKVRLFMAEYDNRLDENGDSSEESVLHSIWTRREEGGNRVVIYDRERIQSPRRGSLSCGGGIAAFVLASQEPLLYTSQHAAYDPVLRLKLLPAPSDVLYYYHALPLGRHGVLEFSFESEDQQKSFAASAFPAAIGSTTLNYLDLYRWISTTIEHTTQETNNVSIQNAAAWARWQAFLTAMSEATDRDLACWKAAAVSHLQALMPRATHVNVLLVHEALDGIDSADAGDGQLIESITWELEESGGRTAPSLNVVHRTLLQSIATYPLGESGLLVIASAGHDDDDSEAGSLASETALFGPLASEVLSFHLAQWTERQRGIAEVQALRQALVEVERTLSIEQERRVMMERHATQQSILLSVSRLLEETEDVASMDERMPQVLHAITVHSHHDAAPQNHFHVGLVMKGDEEDFNVWSSAGNACLSLAPSENRWMTAAHSVLSYDAPLASPQQELVRRLWPGELVVDPCRLTIAMLSKAHSDNITQPHRVGYLVVFESQTGAVADETFTAGLAHAVDCVLAWNSQKRSNREVLSQRDAVIDELKHTQATLETASKSRARGSEMWRSVRSQLWEMETKETPLEVIRAELTKAIQCHVQEQVNACWTKQSQLEVRLVTSQGSIEALLKSTLSEWLRPQEVSRLLSQPRRRLTHEGATSVELCGGLGDQVLAVCWQKDSRLPVITVEILLAVHIGDLSKDPVVAETMQAAIERVLTEAVEMAVAIDNILALHYRIREGKVETDTLAELLEEKALQATAAAKEAAHRSSVGRTLTSLLGGVDVVTTIQEMPTYCLWMRDVDDETVMRSVQQDGTTRTKTYDPILSNGPHAMAIHVNNHCCGVLETTDYQQLEELPLVASVIQSALTQQDLQKQLHTLHIQVEQQTCEVREKADGENRRQSEIVRHWRAIDALLEKRSDSIGEANVGWTETLCLAEQTMQQAFPQVESMRIVFVAVDIERHRVVKTETIKIPDESDIHHRIGGLLDLWSDTDDPNPRTVLVAREDTNAKALIQRLFSPAPLLSSDLFLLAVPTHHTRETSTPPLQSFAVLVGLTTASLPMDIVRAIEMDVRFVATARERFLIHEATRRRAVEAEMAVIAATQQSQETQQWMAFMETIQHNAKQLIHTALDASSNENEEIWRLIEAFVQTACGCDAVEVYDVEETSRRLVPRVTQVASLSPSAQSRAFADSLDALVNASASAPLSMETTPNGHRLVIAIPDRTTDVVIGVLVVHWTHHAAPSDPSLEVIHTIVRPWLAIIVSLLCDRETHCIAQDAAMLQISSLFQQKSQLEIEGHELKHNCTQAEQRTATLQTTVQVASELLQQLKTHITSVAAIEDSIELWKKVAHHVASVKGIHGVQLYEGIEPAMVLSTLSDTEDASVLSSLESEDCVRRCLTTQESCECRVFFPSDAKRVRVQYLDSQPRGLLVVFSSDPQFANQWELVMQYVDLCAVVTSTRAAELERQELQAAAASGLETATHDVTAQLTILSASLAREKRRLAWARSLSENLSHDLLGHDVWKGVEKNVQTLAEAMATVKLTTMWHVLQDSATKRLERAMKTTAASASGGFTVQLFGMVDTEVLFSLPSQTLDRPVANGFFCVQLSQLTQRREWRKMIQCIQRKERVPMGGSLSESGTLLFPVRRLTESYSPGRIQRHFLDGSDEEDDGGHVSHDRCRVVGVLLVKVNKAPVEDDYSAEITQLVQDFADALAPRIDWIGRIVDKKQQRNTPSFKATQRTEMPAYAKGGNQQRGDIPSSDSGGLEKIQIPSARSHDTVIKTRSGKASVPGIGSSHSPSNQDQRQDHDQGHDNNPDDVDSDDERQAERARDRLRIGVTTGVLEFALRSQSVEDKEGSSALLRLHVAREFKSVWCAHGDNRKHPLVGCELFFLSNDGNMSDALEGNSEATTAPPWVVAFASQHASAVTSGFRVWKLDAFNWIASLGLATSVVILVALSGSSSLSRVFDDNDERVHLPSLLKAIGFQATRISKALARGETIKQQQYMQEEFAAQRDTEWQNQCDAWKHRSLREVELSDVTLRLLQATDEGTLIQLALNTMQRFLHCDQVAFHPAVSSSLESPVSNSQRCEPKNAVAMETVLRVRVVALDSEEYERELLGTFVARLTDQERTAMDRGDHGNEWLLRLLQRLADATAAALVGLRQRSMLQQAESTLVSASNEMESHHRQLLVLQDENQRLNCRINQLTAEHHQIQTIEQENETLQCQLEQLKEKLTTSDEAREKIASQLQQYETQWIQINHQLEKSIQAETQLLRLEEIHVATEAREVRLEKKRLKQKLQLKQLLTERTARQEKNERDQAELAELRQQVAVLKEKLQLYTQCHSHHHSQNQNHSGGMDASDVAKAVLQAQAQAMAQTQAVQQQQCHSELQQQQHDRRVHTAVQRKMVRQWQWQWQQQQQKHKQLELAHELRQLAALEVQEMTRRTRTTTSLKKTGQRVVSVGTADIAKVHELRSQQSTTISEIVDDDTKPATSSSRLRPPRIAVAEQRRPSASAVGPPTNVT